MKTAVLLSTMGGPDSLDGVKPFLFNLFNDPAIIRAPQPLRYALAKIISASRDKEAQEIYKKMGGRSPILDNTKAQAAALEKSLSAHGTYRCFVGMSYTKPFIRDALAEIEAYKPGHIVILPLYPQYSTTTTASILRDVQKILKQRPLLGGGRLSVIERFYKNEGFIHAVCEETKKEIANAKGSGEAHILFSAHGLPEKIVKAGDPYQKECEETARLLANKMNLAAGEWTLCYQSRVGPMKWIGPATEDVIDTQAKAGKSLIVVPIAFVCEHSETLVELGIDYAQRAKKAGAARYSVVPTVGVKEAFIQGLVTEIQKINQE